MTKNRIEFAGMSKLSEVQGRLKDLADDFDVISHNLATRINYDEGIEEALLLA